MRQDAPDWMKQELGSDAATLQTTQATPASPTSPTTRNVPAWMQEELLKSVPEPPAPAVDPERLGLSISPQEHRERLVFSHPEDIPKMNAGLSDDLSYIAGKLGFKLGVGTAITGHRRLTTTGNVSRHTVGHAVDVSEINGVSYRSDPKKFAQLATQLQKELSSHGYTVNSESGNQAAVLYGFNDRKRGGNHLNHLHVSNRGNSLTQGKANPNPYVDRTLIPGHPATPMAAQQAPVVAGPPIPARIRQGNVPAMTPQRRALAAQNMSLSAGEESPALPVPPKDGLGSRKHAIALLDTILPVKDKAKRKAIIENLTQIAGKPYRQVGDLAGIVNGQEVKEEQDRFYGYTPMAIRAAARNVGVNLPNFPEKVLEQFGEGYHGEAGLVELKGMAERQHYQNIGKLAGRVNEEIGKVLIGASPGSAIIRSQLSEKAKKSQEAFAANIASFVNPVSQSMSAAEMITDPQAALEGTVESINNIWGDKKLDGSPVTPEDRAMGVVMLVMTGLAAHGTFRSQIPEMLKVLKSADPKTPGLAAAVTKLESFTPRGENNYPKGKAPKLVDLANQRQPKIETPPKTETPPKAQPKPEATVVEKFPEGHKVTDLEGNTFYETRVPTGKIKVKPGLQYKESEIINAKTGETGSLSGVPGYDEGTGGPLTVWEDKDGTLYAMNGHNRLALANRTGHPDLPVKVYREAEGITFEDARVLGALQNLRDGAGTAIDAVAVLRKHGFTIEDLKAKGVALKKDVARNAIGMLNLSDEALAMVRNGQVNETVAGVIGEAGLDEVRSLGIMQEAAESGVDTRRGAEWLTEKLRDAKMAAKVDEGDLFGGVVMRFAYGEQAKIVDRVMAKLAGDEKLFKAITRGKTAGKTIVDVEGQTHAAAIQEFARKVMATDAEFNAILEKEAIAYAEKPTKQNFDAATERVHQAARDAGARRLKELRVEPRAETPTSEPRVGARSEPGEGKGESGGAGASVQSSQGVDWSRTTREGGVWTPDTEHPPVTPKGKIAELAAKATDEAAALHPKFKQVIEDYQTEVILGHEGPIDRAFKAHPEWRDSFEDVREALRAEHGDTIKLWRAEDIEPGVKGKTLSAYTNKKSIAEQFMADGRVLVEREVPVDSIAMAIRTPNRPLEFLVENSKLTKAAEAKGPLIDVPEDFDLTAPKETPKPAAKSESPAQASLSPEHIGDKKGQLGFDIDELVTKHADADDTAIKAKYEKRTAESVLAEAKATNPEIKGAMMNIDPADFAKIIKKGALYVEYGYRVFAEAMIRHYGEWVNPHLETIWKEAGGKADDAGIKEVQAESQQVSGKDDVRAGEAGQASAGRSGREGAGDQGQVQEPAGARQAQKAQGQGKVEPESATSVALAEAERKGLLPDDPGVRKWVQVAEEAKQGGHGTKQGAAKSLAKSKAGGHLTDTETMGVSVRLAAINDELAKTPRSTPKYAELLQEAKGLYSIRHTSEARALASRALLIEQNYTPQGFVTALEIKTGGMWTDAEMRPHKILAQDYADSQARITALQAELDRIRKNPPAENKSASTPQIRRKEAIAEIMRIAGKMSSGIDPAYIKPIGKLVKSYIDELGDIRLAIKAAQEDLKATLGTDFKGSDLHDAALAYGKDRLVKRAVTEQLIWERRRAAMLRNQMDNVLDGADLTRGKRLAQFLAKGSTEIKLWNPIARAIDLGSTIQEATVASFSSPLERPIANFVASVMKSDARWAQLKATQKIELASRYVNELKIDLKEAKSGYDGVGPMTHFAGMLDAPGRAWHFLSYAGERAAALSKRGGGAFGDILDQIRDPYSGGPLSFEKARKLHDAANDHASIAMLNNANWTTRARGLAHTFIENSVPDAAKPIGHFLTDMGFQFSRVLVNVADKSGQYGNPWYAAGRAALELMPGKSRAPLEVRIRSFAQIARRAGLGAAVSQIGYWYYQDQKAQGNDPEKVLTLGKVPMGPQLVRVIDKKGKPSGTVYQDDGYLVQLGGLSSAFFTGYRNAQIDQSSLSDTQKAKLKQELILAPLTDNPVASNVSRVAKGLDGGANLGETGMAWLAALYFPGGLREWSHIQDLQEGVTSRRATNFAEENRKRFPTIGKFNPKLPPKAVPIGPAPQAFLPTAVSKELKAVEYDYQGPRADRDESPDWLKAHPEYVKRYHEVYSREYQKIIDSPRYQREKSPSVRKTLLERGARIAGMRMRVTTEGRLRLKDRRSSKNTKIEKERAQKP